MPFGRHWNIEECRWNRVHVLFAFYKLATCKTMSELNLNWKALCFEPTENRKSDWMHSLEEMTTDWF